MRLKLILTLLVVFTLNTNAEAQFLKKLMSGFGNQVELSELPDSYNFDYRYSLKMTHKKGEVIFNYYLKKDADYFGSLAEMKNINIPNGMLMVHDRAINAMTIFTDKGGGKTAQVIANPSSDEDQVDDMSDATIKKLPSKEVLGYSCEGYETETKDFRIVTYVLVNAPVSLNNTNATMMDRKKLPKGFDPSWLKNSDNHLIMEMHFTHKRKKKIKGSMICVALEKEPLTINVAEYDFPQYDISKGLKN